MVGGIHIFGASGSGTTTLGRALAARLGLAHFDTDDYFWVPTDPPYVTIRPREERQRLLRADLDRLDTRFVLSGSICGRGDYWGRPFVERFGLVVFLYVPTAVRLARLRERERARFGQALDPGGALHEEHVAFMRWAEQYDTFPPTERSLALHEEWMATLTCPIIKFIGERSVTEMVAQVVAAYEQGDQAFETNSVSRESEKATATSMATAKEMVQCPR